MSTPTTLSSSPPAAGHGSSSTPVSALDTGAGKTRTANLTVTPAPDATFCRGDLLLHTLATVDTVAGWLTGEGSLSQTEIAEKIAYYHGSTSWTMASDIRADLLQQTDDVPSMDALVAAVDIVRAAARWLVGGNA